MDLFLWFSVDMELEFVIRGEMLDKNEFKNWRSNSNI